mmetsp:Transcript_5107/g.5305  ORF Transcript_5107/g.5305 Transcript_5107/m.5305 type:complete len:96 (+) Transcript_5107:97-384(+)
MNGAIERKYSNSSQLLHENACQDAKKSKTTVSLCELFHAQNSGFIQNLVSKVKQDGTNWRKKVMRYKCVYSLHFIKTGIIRLGVWQTPVQCKTLR